MIEEPAEAAETKKRLKNPIFLSWEKSIFGCKGVVFSLGIWYSTKKPPEADPIKKSSRAGTRKRPLA